MSKYNVCMIGGGIGSMIGSVHRLGAKYCGYFSLVAGCFSRDVHKSKELAELIGISADRVYEQWKDMIDKEMDLSDGARVVVVASPDPAHYEQCMYAMERGMHVICDKPLTITATEALDLKTYAYEHNLLCGVTYTHNGNPAIVALKELVSSGALGNIRMLRGHIFAPWGMKYIEDDPSAPMYKQAWRLKKEYGIAGALSDVGSHVYQYMHDVSGLRPTQMVADLNIMVEERTSDDSANTLFRYEDYEKNIGVTGVLTVSLAMTSSNEGMSIEVLGDKGGAKVYTRRGSRKCFLSINRDDQSNETIIKTLEFLGNKDFIKEYDDVGADQDLVQMFSAIYKMYGEALQEGRQTEFESYPSVQHGYEGMVFIDGALESHETRGWVDLRFE